MKKNSKPICWYFPIDKSGKYSAFNNHDLERFKKGRYKSLTREVIQNSIDAKDPGNIKPVLVSFELIQLPIEQFPDLDGFKEKIEGCLKMAPRDGSADAAVPWFEGAKGLLEQANIPVLKMSDFNTLGMAGPCELGKPFFSFIKAMGNPTKLDETAAGGHGIGKRAPLLSSRLRTLVASTVYSDSSGDQRFLSQGFSLLISHEERQSDTGIPVMHSHEGYWGLKNGCMPVEQIEQVPEPLRRIEQGTDIFLLGFDQSKNWERKIIAHAITNFFAAFARGTLEFQVGDYKVDQQSIGDWFAQVDTLKTSLEDEEEIEALVNSNFFYQAIVGTDESSCFSESRQVREMGEIEVRLMVQEGLPQELCLIRKNMLILTQFPTIKRFPNYKDFVAVIECKSAKGERLIRSIEPSRHDSLEFDQLEREEDRAAARSAIKKMALAVREAIKKHALESTVRGGAVDFLSHFLADEDAEGSYEAGDLDPQGRIDIKPKKLLIKPTRVPDVNPPPPPPKPTPPPGVPDEQRPNSPPPAPGTHMNLAKLSRVIEKPQGGHRIAFSLDQPGSYRVSVYAVGLESDHKIPITKTTIGAVSSGDILLNSNQLDERFVADISLERPSAGAYRVVCKEVTS